MTEENEQPKGKKPRIEGVSLAAAYLAVTGAIFAYFLWFGLFNRGGVSNDPEDWAHFGDYLTGTASPVITFLALLWLVKSVRTQESELTETKKALKDSASYARIQVRISSLSAVLSSHIQTIMTIEARKAHSLDILHRNMLSATDDEEFTKAVSIGLDRMNKELDQTMNMADRIRDELNAIVLAHPVELGANAAPVSSHPTSMQSPDQPPPSSH